MAGSISMTTTCDGTPRHNGNPCGLPCVLNPGHDEKCRCEVVARVVGIGAGVGRRATRWVAAARTCVRNCDILAACPTRRNPRTTPPPG
jgi:hypothetical protein